MASRCIRANLRVYARHDRPVESTVSRATRDAQNDQVKLSARRLAVCKCERDTAHLDRACAPTRKTRIDGHGCRERSLPFLWSLQFEARRVPVVPVGMVISHVLLQVRVMSRYLVGRHLGLVHGSRIASAAGHAEAGEKREKHARDNPALFYKSARTTASTASFPMASRGKEARYFGACGPDLQKSQVRRA